MKAIFKVGKSEVGSQEVAKVEEVVELDFDKAKSILKHDMFDPNCKNFSKAVFELSHAREWRKVLYYNFKCLK